MKATQKVKISIRSFVNPATNIKIGLIGKTVYNCPSMFVKNYSTFWQSAWFNGVGERASIARSYLR